MSSITKNLGGFGLLLRMGAAVFPLGIVWLLIAKPSFLEDGGVSLVVLLVVSALFNGILFCHGIIADKETLQANSRNFSAQQQMVAVNQASDYHLSEVIRTLRVMSKTMTALQVINLKAKDWPTLINSMHHFGLLLETRHLGIAEASGAIDTSQFVEVKSMEPPPGYREGDIPYDDLRKMFDQASEDLEEANHQLHVFEQEQSFEREANQRYVRLAQDHIRVLSVQNLMQQRDMRRTSALRWKARRN